MKNRKCGDCRECCIVLEVEPIGSGRDEPCKHQCKAGCEIYSQRPDSCRTFTCAWLEGMFAHTDRPDKTHMVTWASKLMGVAESELEVVQCNIGRGRKRDRKTMRKLIQFSYTFPVLIVGGNCNELFSHGRSVVKWSEGDFIRFDVDDQSRAMINGRVVPRGTVLNSPEAVKDWDAVCVNSVTVIESDPRYRKAQLENIRELT